MEEPKSIQDLLRIIKQDLDEIKKKINSLEEKIDNVDKTGSKMSKHIDFIDDTYNNIKDPLNFITKNVKRFMGIDDQTDLPTIESKKREIEEQ